MRSAFANTVSVLAALVLPLAAAAAAPASGVVSGEVFVKLPGAASAGGGEIEVESFSWGPTVSAYELQRTFVKSWSTSGDADAPPRGSGANQLSMDDTAGKERSAARKDMVLKGKTIGENAAVGANETLTVGGNRTETASGLPTGKRQHKPFTLSKPLDKGSVWLRVASPWAACRVGARYPTLELAGGGRRYLLQDVAVASCGAAAAPHEIAFSYQAMKFQ